MLAAALHGLCALLHSLLPAFLVVVVVLWAAAGRRPLGAAVLLSLLQELVQTEGILLKLNGPFPPLPMICTWELLVWNKPNVGQEKKKKNYYGVQQIHSWFVLLVFCPSGILKARKRTNCWNDKLTARRLIPVPENFRNRSKTSEHYTELMFLYLQRICWGQTFSFLCFVQWWNTLQPAKHS